MTTRAVLDELDRGGDVHPAIRAAVDQSWIRVVPCDGLHELYLFGMWLNRLGESERNAGEATVLAWAEAHDAAAYIDDQVACNVGRQRGVRVHRTLRLVVDAYRSGAFGEDKAQELVRSLADVDARFPRQVRDDLFGWARSRNPPLV